MSQKFKPQSENETINKDSLREQFNQIRSKKIAKADTKIVNIKIRIGCGCGGAYDKFNIEVPIDSKIRDGQVFNDFDENWKNIKDGWV